jgi:hypothetical protein
MRLTAKFPLITPVALKCEQTEQVEEAQLRAQTANLPQCAVRPKIISTTNQHTTPSIFEPAALLQPVPNSLSKAG